MAKYDNELITLDTAEKVDAVLDLIRAKTIIARVLVFVSLLACIVSTLWAAAPVWLASYSVFTLVLSSLLLLGVKNQYLETLLGILAVRFFTLENLAGVEYRISKNDTSKLYFQGNELNQSKFEALRDEMRKLGVKE